MMLRLADDANTRSVEVEQMMGAIQRQCSVCEAQVDHRDQLDASGRCDECRP